MTGRAIQIWRNHILVLFCTILMIGALCNKTNAQTVQQIKSPGGIQSWLVEDHTLPLIVMQFSFEGGSLQDPSGRDGLSNFLSKMLTEGAGDLNAAEFKERLGGLGSQFSVSTTRQAVSGTLAILSKTLDTSCDLLRVAVTNPRFDAAAIELIRKQLLTSLAIEEEQPLIAARNIFYEKAFAAHPYHRNVNGTPKSIQAITRDDLVAHHKRLFAKDNLRVVVVGDLDAVQTKRLLDNVFGALPEKAELSPVSSIFPAAAEQRFIERRPLALSTAVFAASAPPLGNKDHMAAVVLNHILGSGNFDSELTNEVRVKRGLTYSIGSQVISNKYTSFVLGAFATQNSEMGRALNVVESVFERIRRDGPSQAALDYAKSNLTGSFLLDFTTSPKIASLLMTAWLDGRGPDYLIQRNQAIGRVTQDDVKRVAHEMLRPENFIFTIVGQPAITGE